MLRAGSALTTFWVSKLTATTRRNSSSGCLELPIVFYGPIVVSLTIPLAFYVFYALVLHHPVQRGLAVDHIVPCLKQDAAQSDALIVDHGGLVTLLEVPIPA